MQNVDKLYSERDVDIQAQKKFGMVGGWYYANSVSLMTLLDSYRASGFIIVKIKIKISTKLHFSS